MPVVTSFELDDLVPTGVSPRQTNRRHRRFRTAVDHAHLLDGRNVVADHSRYLDLVAIGNAKTDSLLGSVTDRVDDGRRGMPENGGAPGPYVVDHFISIDIPNPTTSCSLHEEGISVDISKGSDRRVDSSRDHFFCCLEEFGGKVTVGHRVHQSTRNRVYVNQQFEDGTSAYPTENEVIFLFTELSAPF